jgi:hypothetical protein
LNSSSPKKKGLPFARKKRQERDEFSNSLPPPQKKEEESKQKESKIMAGFWTTFLQREPIVVWSCALGAIGAALPVCVPPIRNMLRADQEPTRPPSAQSVVEALRGGKS